MLSVVLALILALALAFGLSCLEGWLVMLVWNAVVPLVWAGAPTLTFWVTMGIMFLLNILLGTCRRATVKISKG